MKKKIGAKKQAGAKERRSSPSASCSGCIANTEDSKSRKEWIQKEALRYYGYAVQQAITVKEMIESGQWGAALDTLARVKNDIQSSEGYLRGLHILTAPQYGPNALLSGAAQSTPSKPHHE